MTSYKPSILVIPDNVPGQDFHACASIRLQQPYFSSAIRKFFDVQLGSSLSLKSEKISALVLQRGIQPGAGLTDLEELFTQAQKKGVKVIYDIDDNLLDTHPDAESEIFISKLRPLIRFAIREADLVTVSTQPLARRIAKINPRVVHLANGVSEGMLNGKRKINPSATLRIGYYGTYTHRRDFMSIAAQVRAALNAIRRPLTLELIGISKDERILELFDGINLIKDHPVTGCYSEFTNMMMKMDAWDIGLAPLSRGSFEDCKSDIKFLEYSCFGFAGVYSNVPAYDTIHNNVTGLICKDSCDDWKEQIIKLANDDSLRSHLISESRRYTMESRTFEHLSVERINALTKVLDGA